MHRALIVWVWSGRPPAGSAAGQYPSVFPDGESDFRGKGCTAKTFSHGGV